MTCTALPSNDDIPAWLAEDRRDTPRSRTIFCHGKLLVSGIEQICQVRNISARGISLESRGLPQPGQRVRIEMRGMDAAPAIVVWRDQSRCGLVFEAEQDIEEIFSRRRGSPGPQPRGPRFTLSLPVEMASPKFTYALKMLDISIGGLKLRGAIQTDAGSNAVIRCAGMIAERRGRVCWKRGDEIGFQFDQALPREDLFNILNFASGV